MRLSKQARFCSWLAGCAWFAAVAGCNISPQRTAVAEVALQGPQQQVADLCGFVCADRGIGDGNAAISGVNSPDALFDAVVGFGRASDALAQAIEDELRAIGADFGVSGELGAGIAGLSQKQASAPLRVHAGQPECSLDAAALLDAQARCDAELKRSSAELRCAGSCQLPPDTQSCPKGATLRCTRASAGRCSGLCRGACSVSVSGAACAGDCRGSCDGSCLALLADGSCAGPCSSNCTGQCAKDSFDFAACDGDCAGECAEDTQSGGCAGALPAECVVPSTGESVACAGRCRGEPVAAAGRPECALAAKVEATLELACRPGAVSVAVFPSAMPEDAVAEARYLAAVANLERRLPRVLVLAERGERLFAVGDDLRKAPDDGKLAASFAAQNAGDIDTRFAVGLECAADQLPGITQLVDKASPRLQAALDAVDALRRGLGIATP